MVVYDEQYHSVWQGALHAVKAAVACKLYYDGGRSPYKDATHLSLHTESPAFCHFSTDNLYNC